MGGGLGGLWVVGGSLVVARAEAPHAGHYTCLANNTGGHARLSVHLFVTLPLSVQVCMCVCCVCVCVCLLVVVSESEV